MNERCLLYLFWQLDFAFCICSNLKLEIGSHLFQVREIVLVLSVANVFAYTRAFYRRSLVHQLLHLRSSGMSILASLAVNVERDLDLNEAHSPLALP
jgi:hypothetical protein